MHVQPHPDKQERTWGTKASACSMRTGGAVAEAAHPAIAKVLLAPPALVAVPAPVHAPRLPLLRTLEAQTQHVPHLLCRV